MHPDACRTEREVAEDRIAMLESANDGWQRSYTELEAALATAVAERQRAERERDALRIAAAEASHLLTTGALVSTRPTRVTIHRGRALAAVRMLDAALDIETAAAATGEASEGAG